MQFGGMTLQKECEQMRNILLALSLWRQVQAEPVDSVVQVLAKTPFAHLGFQILGGTANQPRALRWIAIVFRPAEEG